MRHCRSPRIVSVCVHGKRTTTINSNPSRLALMEAVIINLVEQWDWHPIDAIVFPGAYFRLPRFLGGLTERQRIDELESLPFVVRAVELASDLMDRNDRCHVVFGADSSDPRYLEYGDQFCIAVNFAGVTGLAPKLFPTDLDTAVERPYVPSFADYGSRKRYVRLRSGHQAILCSCYDVFGLADDPEGLPRGSRAIRDLFDGVKVHSIEERGFAKLRRRAIKRWKKMVAASPPEVALTSIHGFERQGRDAYFQRHGVAFASASMRGGLSVGAAHFVRELPAPYGSTLAASRVPTSQKWQGSRRRSWALSPNKHFVIASGALTALVRLFAPN